MKSATRRTVLAAAAAFAAAITAGAAQAKTQVMFYYPIQVGGPLTQVIDGYVAKFKAANPDIEVQPVYSGNYIDTTTKSLTAAKSGKPPTVAVLLATDIFTLIDEDVVQPIDDFAKTPEDKAWIAGFMPAFLKSAQVDGHLWAAPFQRSTAVLYYNKKAFAEAGLDPHKPPTTWDDMVKAGKAVLKKDDAGKTTRWGVGIPGNVGSAQWLFGALAAQNGARLMNDAGTEAYLTDPKVVEALQFWVDLSKVHGIHPPGIQEWGTTPADFLEQRIAMVWTTTGNLTNIGKNATFDFGLAPYPGKVSPASVLGGGNLYIFSGAPQAEKEAGFKFIKFLTSDETLADWAIQTGYVAPRDGAWEQPSLKAYVAKTPAAEVAKKQIAVSVPEFSTHENNRTTKALNDALAAALTGAKTPAQALADGQAEIDRILKPYKK
ncbi:ABC transporter substrate-binding protein [Alsobacter metallidurans]|uniref:ABC transporter substrate-binding protein n=1 Tax=Alsobacter metallidurans TaxID=340221 RepID=A0A917IBE3_9HYPH|nr:ABC transporter substrate-binding protein [Alsobacter metallidurans]GGH31750.1 ABC transporter substrate-binding protein [Alsobacter metallidurans]